MISVDVRRSCPACEGFGCSGCDWRGAVVRRYGLEDLRSLDDAELHEAVARAAEDLDALLAEQERRQAAEKDAA